MQLEHRRYPPDFAFFVCSLIECHCNHAAPRDSCETFAARISQRVVPTNSSVVFTAIYDQMSQKPHCLQSLSFLPHVLQISAPWPILDIQTVANKCGIRSECFTTLGNFLHKHFERPGGSHMAWTEKNFLHKHLSTLLSLASFVPKSSNIALKRNKIAVLPLDI